jgi:hypothetical protein
MTGLLTALGNHVAAHPTPYALLGMSVVTAIIRHMPEQFPRSLDDLWTWIRGAAQEAANQKGNPTLPGL